MIHYTTIEQSKKLVELGLDPLTSDMYYSFMGEHIKDAKDEDFSVSVGLAFAVRGNHFSYRYGYIIPCWSLGALMDLLPPSIQTGEGMQNQYEIDIRKYWGNEENLYQIAYGNNRGLSEEWHDMINTGEKENLTDAVLDMVCWLLKNKYIKKGK